MINTYRMPLISTIVIPINVDVDIVRIAVSRIHSCLACAISSLIGKRDQASEDLFWTYTAGEIL